MQFHQQPCHTFAGRVFAVQAREPGELRFDRGQFVAQRSREKGYGRTALAVVIPIPFHR
jgi:hypothetical protein